MVRVNANDIAENIKFLNMYKRLDYEKKRTLLIDKVFLNREEWLKREYLDLMIKLLDDSRFQKIFIKKLKLPDLFLFIQIYSLSIKYKSDPNKVLQESFAFKNKTHNSKLIKDISKKTKNLIDAFKSSPIDFLNNGIFIKDHRFIEFLKFMIDGNKLAFVDDKVLTKRYEELLHQTRGNEDLQKFVKYLKDNKYLSSIDDGYSEATLYQKAYNYSKKFKYFSILDLIQDIKDDISCFLHTQATIRRDNYSHRTVFIKEIYNVDVHSKPYDLDLILLISEIFFEDLSKENLLTKGRLKEILKEN
ncbi:hypothetical protein [Acinetobacter lwoffii]|uniref:hypothetical protein n=1 Tax=Acinetobacter lwoffii TaxID=28090 RepID=UPI002097835C|nr:hypothetical protein [Acinetobacter lwoffii]MCO8083543.1 hypothetical protein [Acinetobacter lwoffii]